MVVDHLDGAVADLLGVVVLQARPSATAIELPSTLPSHQRSMFQATSSAVKASPLFQVTPWRTFSVYSVASSLTSQPSSSIGWKLPSFSYSTRYSSQPREKFAICDQS